MNIITLMDDPLRHLQHDHPVAVVPHSQPDHFAEFVPEGVPHKAVQKSKVLILEYFKSLACR